MRDHTNSCKVPRRGVTMKALTKTQKAANSRLRIRAKAFADDYLDGEWRVPVDRFLNAMLAHSYIENDLTGTLYYGLLQERGVLGAGGEGIGVYASVVVLMEAWEDACRM